MTWLKIQLVPSKTLQTTVPANRDQILEDFEIADICNRINSGDSTAFDEVVDMFGERFKKQVRVMLRGYPRLRRWEETDDVYQTVLIKLHRSLTSIEVGSAAEVFALAVTQIRRTLIDMARHYFGKQGIGANHFSDDDLRKNETQSDNHGSPQSVLETKSAQSNEPSTLAQWSEFHSAVESLEIQYREVFQLVWYAEMTHTQIARLLEISERTVLRRLNEARIELAKTLT